jgi:adenosylmethionine-8-amino-7-oxononanoate aminotransferase
VLAPPFVSSRTDIDQMVALLRQAIEDTHGMHA